MCCRGGANATAAVTDGHGAARFREEIDRRWPWLKCQVDRPSGARAITAAAHNTPKARGPPRKRRENGVEVPTDGEDPNKLSSV
eukprot:scaffold173249_cov57-Cyclotella_meneghiniana.AAC.2